MNILLTCAGRRNYLVHYFRDALVGRGHVFAADASRTAPTLADADQGFVVPPLSDPRYFDAIERICREYEVKLIVSLNDLELPLISQERERFAALGVQVVVSQPSVINICFDKWATVKFLESCGLQSPRTFISLRDALDAIDSNGSSLTFPLVLKPRWGTASIGIEYPEDRDDLIATYKLLQRRLQRSALADVSRIDPQQAILIQERLSAVEYGLDVINDLHGNYVTTFAKQKLSMRAGETDRAMTVKNSTLDNIGRTIGQKLGHLGNLDCDVFLGEQGSYVLELNPRFGGGYPFSHVAGANIPAAILAWAAGKAVEPSWLEVQPNVTSGKADNLVVHADVSKYKSYGT